MFALERNERCKESNRENRIKSDERSDQYAGGLQGTIDIFLQNGCKGVDVSNSFIVKNIRFILITIST